MTKFLIIRHGQTEYNSKQTLQGQIDSPLTDIGVQNAYNSADILSKHNLNFDLVYSSDLGRAFRTCYLILAKKQLLHLEIKTDKRLREIDFGDITNMSKEIRQKYPHYKDQKDFCFPGGECFRDMEKRVFNFLDEKQKDYQNQNVLVVCHGGVINILLENFTQIDIREFRISNEFIGKLEYSKKVSFEIINN